MFELSLLLFRYIFLAMLYFFLILVVRLIYLDLYEKRQAIGGSHVVVLQDPNDTEGLDIILGDELKIGRDPENELLVDDVYASGFHARIYRQGKAYFVEDLGSTNGTFLGDRRVSAPVALRTGDRIRIGQKTLVFEE